MTHMHTAIDKKMERTLKALANGRRLAVMAFLKNGRESSVGVIAHHIGLSFKATSKHLGILASVEILTKEQRSLTVYYRLNNFLPEYVRSVLSLL